MPEIFGLLTDQAGRCQHWHQPVDIIANKCQICQKYFACYLCHDALTSHDFQPMPTSQISVMCGICHFEMSGNTYAGQEKCPACLHAFNPKCHLHHDIYFC
ncbi:CHY zinc finger protein [Leuconostoc rapi]|uniref:CHY zinc finger protein n=1 Tax=Leuconostoc rapi TaxID=1406906 RepID=UPI00195F1EA8|nr:CHY zinc finger protein [Leuconostoc rapi]MBM7436364.1 putative CHY-type Zn-finger protein [Leuconostoc rapi]